MAVSAGIIANGAALTELFGTFLRWRSDDVRGPRIGRRTPGKGGSLLLNEKQNFLKEEQNPGGDHTAANSMEDQTLLLKEKQNLLKEKQNSISGARRG
jgi:hypothetical protein